MLLLISLPIDNRSGNQCEQNTEQLDSAPVPEGGTRPGQSHVPGITDLEAGTSSAGSEMMPAGTERDERGPADKMDKGWSAGGCAVAIIKTPYDYKELSLASAWGTACGADVVYGYLIYVKDTACGADVVYGYLLYVKGTACRDRALNPGPWFSRQQMASTSSHDGGATSRTSTVLAMSSRSSRK